MSEPTSQQSARALELRDALEPHLAAGRDAVIRPAEGKLAHDYLAPAPSSVYPEQWDWDAFYMSLAQLQRDPARVYLLQGWALNNLENADEDGRVAGCITPEGNDPRLHHMKPYLAQGVLIASRVSGDYEWIRPHWDTLKRVVLHRENYIWDKRYDMPVWHNAMECGADNVQSIFGFVPRSVISADLVSYLVREYRAMAYLAREYGMDEDYEWFKQRSRYLHHELESLLWHEEDEVLYNRFVGNDLPIRRVTYTSFIPLWGKVLSEDKARATIERYLINPESMFGPHGLRTADKRDEVFNNINILKPVSNWQGPMWPMSNYVFTQGLLSYGYAAEACESAIRCAECVLRDIETSGGMHENYHSETGEPLAAPNFFSWNLLLTDMLEQTSGSVAQPAAFMIEDPEQASA